MRRVERDALYRADNLALRFIKVSDTLGAEIGVNLINFYPGVDGLVRALRFADVAVDAFVGND